VRPLATRVKSAAGAVALAEGVVVVGGFRLGAGASVSAVTLFPTAAHRTGPADLPHPALGRASRESMHGPLWQARLVDIDHSLRPVDLGVPETARETSTSSLQL
jgi:hypothetical protein